MRLTRTFIAFALALAACDDGMGNPDSGGDGDAGRFDAGRFDAGPFFDAGRDAGRDAGMTSCGSLTLPSLSTESVDPDFDWGGGGYFPIVVAQPAGSDDLYVATQEGRVVIVRAGNVITAPFLDLRGTVDFEGRNSERGLLGLAFHPDYATNGRFFIYYTSGGRGDDCASMADGCRNIVAEYARSASPDVANATEVQRLLDLADFGGAFAWNHNGGGLVWGRDGFLYASVGDGGAFDDLHGTNGNGQNLDSAFGKIHRLDVDNAPTFVAAGNPFATGSVPTIWSYGLRNPWRFSFDRTTGDLWIGDVGQGEWEEIDFQPSGRAGDNYGWARFEGEELFRNDVEILPAGTTPIDPTLVYGHFGGPGVINGLAVVGGYVYRGSAIPALQGWYLFGDYVNAPVAALRMCEGSAMGVQEVGDLSGVLGELTSFGEDDDGELYLVGDSVVRIVSP